MCQNLIEAIMVPLYVLPGFLFLTTVPPSCFISVLCTVYLRSGASNIRESFAWTQPFEPTHLSMEMEIYLIYFLPHVMHFFSYF